MYYEMFKDAAGQWRWHLIAANGRKIADSGEGYTTKEHCQGAIDLVKTSSNAPVREK